MYYNPQFIYYQFKQTCVDSFEVTCIVIDQLMKYESVNQPVSIGR